MRVRMVCEAIINKDIYMDHEQLGKGLQCNEIPSEVNEVYATLSGSYDDENTLEDQSVIFNNMIWKWRIKGREAGQWMYHIVANLIQKPIVSIYPFLKRHEDGLRSAMAMRQLYNRVIHPTDDCMEMAAIAIMWTDAGGRSGEPNHFVSVVP